MAYNFPDTPTLGQVYSGYVWNGESWQVQGATASGAVRYDTPQGLNANQQAQARSNVGVTKKNYIINGAMMVSQENGSTAGTTSGYYPVDMFNLGLSNAGTPTIQQVANVTPSGSPNRLRVTVTVAHASVAAGDYCQISYNMEGLRVADLRFGSASAKAVTLQFGVKAPAGTYCATLGNVTGTRAYVSEYVIAAGQANTDTVISLVIPGDVAGTWAADNTTSFSLHWGLMCGTTYQQAAGSWGTVSFAIASGNQFNFMGTVNNVFELFDVSLTEGTVAPPFVVPDYASELAACKRYFLPLPGQIMEAATKEQSVTLPVEMRATPTVTGGGAGFGMTVPNPTNPSWSQTARSVVNLKLNARL